MELRTRSSLALLPTLLCLACGAGTTAEQESTPTVSIAPTPTISTYFAPAARELELVATAFIKTVCQYDASVAGRPDFLSHVEHLVTPAELTRLRTSSRAELPWAALRARRERTEVVVDGISTVASPPPSVRLVARISITTHTSFGTVEALEQVTLTLVQTDAGWQVDNATGAGL